MHSEFFSVLLSLGPHSQMNLKKHKATASRWSEIWWQLIAIHPEFPTQNQVENLNPNVHYTSSASIFFFN